jgi:hypothetical protein
MSSSAPGVGLAFGALVTSVLVQYGPAPTQLVWWLLLAAFAAAFVLVAGGTGCRGSWGSLLASSRRRRLTLRHKVPWLGSLTGGGTGVARGLALPRQLTDRTEVSGLLALGAGQLLGDVGRHTQTGAAKIAD